MEREEQKVLVEEFIEILRNASREAPRFRRGSVVDNLSNHGQVVSS